MKKEGSYRKTVVIVLLLIVCVLFASIGWGNYQQQELLKNIGNELKQRDYSSVNELLQNRGFLLRFSQLFLDEIKKKAVLAEAISKKELGLTAKSLILLDKAKKSSDLNIKRQSYVHQADIFFRQGGFSKSERMYTKALKTSRPDELSLRRLEALKFYLDDGSKDDQKGKEKKRRLREESMLSDLYGSKRPENTDKSTRR